MFRQNSFKSAGQPSNFLLRSIYSDIHPDHSNDEPHMNTHTHTLDLLHADVGRSLFTTLNLHTLTWPIDTERAALPQSRVEELHENISPPESFKDLTQEITKTNPSMWIPSPP